MFYHVTTSDAARSILQDGFMGSWGDAGYGVYLFDDLQIARAYLARGGWDASLDPADAVILAVQPGAGEVIAVDVHPDWPNPQDYANVVWHPMDGDDDEAHWLPVLSVVQTDADLAGGSPGLSSP